ncbi:hypothetical protein C8R42DRAFT_729774 [Lentinula raphanica]|nr:hypothetical protein C8R42DRAFT_729774 [Lentinula raphanica]
MPSRVMTGRQKPLPYQYVPRSFFARQLTAFEVWISWGGSALTLAQSTPPSPNLAASWSSTPHLVPRKPPTQLPIVFQALLSQPHRSRAPILLSQFVDLGPWAVNLVLTIGFLYISKILQDPGPDLRPVCIFILARILAVDSSIQASHRISATWHMLCPILPSTSQCAPSSSHPLLATSRKVRLHAGKTTSSMLASTCSTKRISSGGSGAVFARCSADLFDQRTMVAPERGTRLVNMMSNDSTEEGNKAGGGLGGMYNRDERAHFWLEVAVVTGATVVMREDASPMCRKELVVLISCFVKEWRGWFVVCAWMYWEEERKRRHATVYLYVSANADEVSKKVATQAQTVVDYIMALLLESPFTRLDEASIGSLPLASNNYINSNHSDIPRDTRDAKSHTSSGSNNHHPYSSYIPLTSSHPYLLVLAQSAAMPTLSAQICHALTP